MSTTTNTDTIVADVGLPAPEFSDALFNAQLFCSDPKNARPTLEHVRLRVTRTEVELVACDSYALVRQVVSVDAGQSAKLPRKAVEVLLHCSWAQTWHKEAKALPPHGAVRLRVSGPPKVRVVSAAFGGDEYDALSGDVSYPNTDQLWPTGDPQPTEQIGLGVPMLTRLAKVRGAEPVARLELYGELKPVVVRLAPTIALLQMPARLNGK